MSKLTVEVLARGERRFDIAGQKLPFSLHDTNETISHGLVTRLHRYALKELVEVGFDVSDWDCEVYTMDGGEPLKYRYYTVEFISAKGGSIGVQGIGIGRGGHPTLDHGLCVKRG
jgi:hypothetical protein